MKFDLIDPSQWDRKAYFDHFHKLACSYSMTLNLDLTILLKEIKKRDLKLYPVMIYLITMIVNRHDEFRTSIDPEGRVGIFDILHPCYTIFQTNGDTFTNIWTEYSPTFTEFYERYLQDVKNYSHVKNFMARKDTPVNSFTISSIPWVSFTGFNLNLPNASDYLIPIFTTGKYFEQNGKTWLPISLQVHHAVCDGFHAARFLNELQDVMDRGI